MNLAILDGLLLLGLVGGFGINCAMTVLADSPRQAELYVLFAIIPGISLPILLLNVVGYGATGRRLTLPARCMPLSQETADNGFVMFVVAGCVAAAIAIVVGGVEPAVLVAVVVATASPIRVAALYGKYSGVPGMVCGWFRR